MSRVSLRKRLLITATITLISFLGLAGVALDKAFISSAKTSLNSELRAQINALLAVMEVTEAGQLLMPDAMPESRLSSPNSQLYAFVLDDQATTLWRSGSTLGIKPEPLTALAPGEEFFNQPSGRANGDFYYSFGVAWEIEENQVKQLTLVMINESDHYLRIISSHRKSLTFWLGLAAVLLLVVQAGALHWSLIPLKKVTEELDAIERGVKNKISGQYPKEIAQLSERINLFIENERRNLTRYRNTLGDLAHSLKTPLAVIKGALESNAGTTDETSSLHQHIDRMDKIIEYQLKRAASSQFSIHVPINLEDILGKIGDTLLKVYAEKSLQVEWKLADDAAFNGEEGDLYELLGNVMDNAFKWAHSVVRCETESIHSTSSGRNGVKISVSDDGPGIHPDQFFTIFDRGVRADMGHAGQGIGLSVAREIVECYRGSIKVEDTGSNGTKIVIELPPS